MLKKTMSYTDFDGNQRTEDFYFNLTKAEIIELEYGVDGGLTKMLNRIVAEQDAKRIIASFKDIVLRAYGEKSADGKRFIKSPEIAKAFSETTVYSDIFMDLATNAEHASAFIRAIVPQEIVASLTNSAT